MVSEGSLAIELSNCCEGMVPAGLKRLPSRRAQTWGTRASITAPPTCHSRGRESANNYSRSPAITHTFKLATDPLSRLMAVNCRLPATQAVDPVKRVAEYFVGVVTHGQAGWSAHGHFRVGCATATAGRPETPILFSRNILEELLG